VWPSLKNKMSNYRPLQAAAFNGSSNDSTWINLGWWDGVEPLNGSGFALANGKLASKVLNLALTSPSSANDTVIDCGCGLGDTLHLVSSMRPKMNLIGVNFDANECQMARIKCPDASIICADAVKFFYSIECPSGAIVISVDAMYHFHTRSKFMQRVFETKPKVFAFSDICQSALWESSRAGFFTRGIINLCLGFISLVAGVPRENLAVGPDGLKAQLLNAGFQMANVQVITPHVLLPFSNHCVQRANALESWNQTWVVLYSSGWFMYFLHWTGAVDVVLGVAYV